MQHGIITARAERKVTYYGSKPRFIGAEHKPYGYGRKPAESSFAFIENFQLSRYTIK